MKHIVLLLSILLLIFIAWPYPIFVPLKVLVVFFHEASHAIATLVTGGEVQELIVNLQQGGHVISLGGNRFIGLSAGYLGSLIWGAVIYLLAMKTEWDRFLMAGLAILIGLISLIYGGNLFVIGYGLTASVLMLLSAKFLSMGFNDLLLRLIGLTSMMYVPLDLYSDTILRSASRSDARMLAEEFGGATLLWGGVWIGISVVVIGIVLKWTIRHTKKTNDFSPRKINQSGRAS